ncbi:membrane-bound lytic murein transglycosylase D [Candidatus Magnetomoraceae bacterium gMMP-15]
MFKQILVVIFLLSCGLFTGCQYFSQSQMTVDPYSKVNKHSKQIKESPLELTLKIPFSETKVLSEKKQEKQSHRILSDAPYRLQRAQQILDEALDFCEASQDFWQKGELESALESLDRAYELILSVNEDHPKLIQQREDLRFMISKRILEIYASRNIVVNGSHKAIPITMNKHVKAEIKFLTGVERSFFISAYRRSGKYRPKIVAALKQAGLPTALSWLPLIESGFKVRALSRSRALGLWQFIPSTGYKFGLIRNRFIDERMDPEKSTRAAIAYLQELHNMFGDWTTVLAAYNCGEGRILRTIKKQNINYLDNFWDLYDCLPRETSRYVPRFLATLYIVENMEEFGLDSEKINRPVSYEKVEIAKQLHIRNIATKIGVSEKMLSLLNPELRCKITPPEPYLLKIPIDKQEIVLAAINFIPVSHLAKSSSRSSKSSGSSNKKRYKTSYHTVKQGESLYSIAKHYGVKLKNIIRANHIKNNVIIVGKRLKIPSKNSRKYSRKKLKNTKPIIHIVKKGDSLWNLARRYSTTASKIQKVNYLTENTLYVGQKLKIPGKKRKLHTALSKYKVKNGDSPFQIAQRHNMKISDFLRLNHLSPTSKIFPGQQVFVE